MAKTVKKLPWIKSASISAFIKTLMATVRLDVQDPNGFLDGPFDEPRLYAMWHNRAVTLPALTPKAMRPQLTFLSSRSRDGGYIADVLAHFNMQAVRGSSSKGGVAALKELETVIDEGRSIVMTPDGPRGPRYVPKNGILHLASKKQVPIVPVSFNCKSHHAFRTWDQTQLPYPFAKGELVIGDAIIIPQDLKNADVDTENEKLRLALMAITRHDGPDIAPRERKKKRK